MARISLSMGLAVRGSRCYSKRPRTHMEAAHSRLHPQLQRVQGMWTLHACSARHVVKTSTHTKSKLGLHSKTHHKTENQ